MSKTLLNIGLVYQEQDSLATAEAYYGRALALARANRNANLEALATGNRGNIANQRGNYDEAIKKFLASLQLYETLGDRHGIVRNLGNIGTSYLDAAVDEDLVPVSRYIPADKNARLRLATQYLQGAVDSARHLGFMEAVMFFSQKLSEAHEEAGHPAEALVAYKAYKAAADSILSLESSTRIAELETVREVQLKDKQIEINKLAVAKKRNERIYFIAGLGLLGVVTFFVARERKKSEHLLLNILPQKIAKRLKAREHPIADAFTGVSILFVDMVGFTEFADRRDPKETVSILNDVFTRFDALAEEWGLEKIKTIGDSYMAVAGLPEPRTDHANRAAGMALAVQRATSDYRSPDGERIHFRIGLDCGPVVAGVIGRKKFIYDLWGDAVNTAARMESTGAPGMIQCTDRFRHCVSVPYDFTNLGQHMVKGKGVMETWLIREKSMSEGVVPGDDSTLRTA